MPSTLFTDAKLVAYGAVLVIGETHVEDQTYFRKTQDRRHINVAELIDVHRGIHFVGISRQALNITAEASITLKCDNKSTVAWPTRAKQRHWTSVKGLSAKVVDKCDELVNFFITVLA